MNIHHLHKDIKWIKKNYQIEILIIKIFIRIQIKYSHKFINFNIQKFYNI